MVSGTLPFSGLLLSIPSVSTKRIASSTPFSRRGARVAALPPISPLNPQDPLTASSVASSSSESPSPWPFDNRVDTPPISSRSSSNSVRMSDQAEGAEYASYSRYTGSSDLDLPTTLFANRIVYIGLPLVPAVTELIIAELLYLNHTPKEPIYMYINSTGTTREDGEPLSSETEGFGIHDTMMFIPNKITTLCFGVAVGQACLLLAAGTKGRRLMLPRATAILHQPKMYLYGQQPASTAINHAEEVIFHRDTLVKYIARHTGKSVEAVSKAMRRTLYMDAMKARDFGVIDSIYWRNQEKIMNKIDPPELRKQKEGVKAAEDTSLVGI